MGQEKEIAMEYGKTGHERISLGAAIMHNAFGVSVVMGVFILGAMFSAIV